MTDLTSTSAADRHDGVPPIRRSFLLEAGQPLLAPRSPFEQVVFLADANDVFALRDDEMVVSPLVTLPLPAYPPVWPEGFRRWAGTSPQIMWHPLMWLPERLAGRYTIESDDGVQRLESDDEWAVRVAIELSYSGVYEEGSGGWLDVLALVGIDIDTPDGINRVEAWLDGADDPILDSINLDAGMRYDEDPAYAADIAAAMIPDLQVMSYASHGQVLLETCNNALYAAASDDQPSFDTFRMNLLTIARLGRGTYNTVSDSEAAGWSELIGTIQSVPESAGIEGLVEGPLEAVMSRLDDLVDYFLPLAQHLTDEAPPTPDGYGTEVNGAG